MKRILYFCSPTLFLECIIKLIRHTSLTFLLAKFIKEKWDKTCVIKWLNGIYLVISILLVLFLEFCIKTPFDYSKQSTCILTVLGGYYLWSRSFEILTAFIIDAIDKTKPIEPSSSTLQPRDRIKLALSSYIELILIFALGYWLMPGCWWGAAPKSMFEAVYFSGVTITTLGYGDISPAHLVPQLLTVYEVLCGFSLIVVSFTIYTGLDEYKSEEDKLKEDK